MKRRAVKDTAENRKTLIILGYKYTVNKRGKKKIYINVSNADFNVIKELIDEGEQ